MSAEACPFCLIIEGRKPAVIVAEWVDALAFMPLSPVTEGHTLVVPIEHHESASHDPEVTGRVFQRAAEYASGRAGAGSAMAGAYNLITSAGPAATQTIRHLHVHVVPRREGDGLALPWDPCQTYHAGYRSR